MAQKLSLRRLQLGMTQLLSGCIPSTNEMQGVEVLRIMFPSFELTGNSISNGRETVRSFN